jgi:hypothetical protein
MLFTSIYRKKTIQLLNLRQKIKHFLRTCVCRGVSARTMYANECTHTSSRRYISNSTLQWNKDKYHCRAPILNLFYAKNMVFKLLCLKTKIFMEMSYKYLKNACKSGLNIGRLLGAFI